MTETHGLSQLQRFFSFGDKGLNFAVLGLTALGLMGGLLGSFVVVRRQALVGDMLAHAVLPGIALGYIIAGKKDPLAILIGALVVGSLGLAVSHILGKNGKLKTETAQALVLSSFFAVGVCLLGRIQLMPGSGKAGLDKFLFGQPAALQTSDVWVLLITTGIVLILTVCFFRGWLVMSFDRQYGRALGFSARWLDGLFLGLVAVAVVVSMESAGIVLVSALLVIPAAAACLWHQRLSHVAISASSIGAVSGFGGALLSFLVGDLPTGPCIVIIAAGLFAISFCLSPQGWLIRLLRRHAWRKRTDREDVLKSLHKLMESGRYQADAIPVAELSRMRAEYTSTTHRRLTALARRHLVLRSADKATVALTGAGLLEAEKVIRAHRLWELYLTDVAQFRPDHVHDAAELMEHVLPEDLVARLDARLANPAVDPHGKVIPGGSATQRLNA